MIWRWLVLLGGLLALAGCGNGPQQRAVMALPVRDEGDTFLAGTAMADITPPLHLALFGHGPEGRVAAGVRSRLRCQVFILASRGELVALVPCDLQSPSFAVRYEVASRLQQLGVPLTADRILLMATHTHGAPGHYFDDHYYSGTFSSPIPGYDKDVTAWIADGIAGAIVDAFSSLDRVCLGFSVSKLPGLTVNRAYTAFLHNDRSGAPALSQPQRDLLERARKADRRFAGYVATDDEQKEDLALSGPQVAVDNQLTVLRIDRQGANGKCTAKEPPVGVLAVYGMHPTGAPNTNDLYHGDIFGFATRTAATCLRGAAPLPDRDATSTELWLDDEHRNPCGALDGPAQPNPGYAPRVDPNGPVLVGLANGVEGDVSPNVDYQSIPTARQLGRRLGIEIARAAVGIKEMSPTGTLAHFYRELDFRSGRYNAKGQHLCQTAELGMASAGGAPDGPTRVRIIPEANAGFRLNESVGCHTYKMPLRIMNAPSPYNFATVGPITLVRLQLTNDKKLADSLWLGAIPAEATTMTGFGIRGALKPLADQGPLRGLDEHLALVGLTNQYFQYVATAPEYEFQHYEGASTLYGPHSAEFLAYQFECLARDAKDGGQHCNGTSPINVVGATKPHPPASVSRMPPDDQDAPLILEALDWRRNQRGGALGWEIEFEPLPLVFTKDRNLMKLQLLAGKDGQTVLDDDRGSAFELHEFVRNDETRWRVRWIPYLGPGPNPICGQTVRLAIDGRRHFESKAFTVDCNLGTPDGGTL